VSTATIRRVIVPSCPADVLSPNARVHWSARNRAVREYRALAKYAAMQDGRPVTVLGPVDISVRVLWPARRRKSDADNALASCKAALDGLVDAGVIGDDRQVQRMSIEQEKLDKAGRVHWPQGAVIFDIEEIA
jgi:Holliday junction resolvase RusA-like endonuclease